MPNSLFQLPQYQGDYYQLQRQQALANALMGNALQSRAPTQTVGSGGSQNYQVMPAMSPLAGVSQLAQAYLSGKVANQASAGLNQLGNNMWNSMQSMFGGQPAAFMGGAQPSPQPVGTSSAVAGGADQNADVGPGGVNGDLSANAGGAVPNVAPNGAAGAIGSASNVTAMNPSGMNPTLAALMYMQDPSGYAKNFIAPYYQPAAIVQQIRAAGIDPNSGLGRQLAQQALAKQNYIAPVNARPGSILRDPLTMQPMAYNPHVPEGGTPVFDASGNVVGIQQLPGAAQVAGAMSTAKASGPAQFSLQRVWNPQTGQYDYQSTANIAGAVNGAPPAAAQPGQPGQPAPIRNNNPGALMPGGRLAQYPDMQTGLAQLDSNLQAYGKDGINTLAGVISKWAPPNENNTQAYIQDVSQRLGIPANQKIDLTNPLQRQAVATAIALHENGPQGVFGSGQPASAGAAPGTSGVAAAPGASGVAATPPLGAQQAAEASQIAPSQQMSKAYGALSNSDVNYQASRAALLTMLRIAQNGGIGDSMVRLLPDDVATRISNDAAEYEKAHANFVALQGKALGGGGTDAARATLDEAVPTFDKPQQAKIAGLTNQLQQLDLAHLKTQFLTPIYQKGDEKAFTQLSAGFDNNVTPQMLPVLQLSGPQQQAQVQAAVKANPSLRSNYEWAFNNGLLK